MLKEILFVLSHFSRVPLFAILWIVAHQAPLSVGFSRQEYWVSFHALLQGIFLAEGSNHVSCFAGRFFTAEPLGKWNRSVVSDSLWPHGLQPTRFFHAWDFPGKSTGMGCHFLLCHWGSPKEILCMHAELLQSCLTLCNPMDYCPPGSSVLGILQAGILEWVANSSHSQFKNNS